MELFGSTQGRQLHLALQDTSPCVSPSRVIWLAAFAMAPPKPSVQSQFLLDAMEAHQQRQDENWKKLKEKMDLLLACMTDFSSTQQQMLAQMDLNTKTLQQASYDQQLMLKQVRANGKALACLALEQKDAETEDKSARSLSPLFSIPPRQEQRFSGGQPHPTEPNDCRPFAVETESGAYAHREALNELFELEQTGTVEDYVTTFQALQFQLSMHNPGYDELFFICYFIKGLKWDIRAAVEVQLPDTMARAILLAKVQQRILVNSKQNYQKSSKALVALGKVDPKPSPPGLTLWEAQQLRDYRRANNLCLYCGGKFDANHIEHCTKGRKAAGGQGVTPAKLSNSKDPENINWRKKDGCKF